MKIFIVVSMFMIVMPLDNLFAQRPSDLTSGVQMEIISNDPPQIKFNWTPAKNTKFQLLYRRDVGSRRWRGSTRLDPADTTYIDTLELGVNYEYQLRSLGDLRAYDYMSAGIEVGSEFLESKGGLILMIDSMLVDSLSDEIATTVQDIENDGWVVHKLVVSRSERDFDIRDSIRILYDESNQLFRAVFILGHVTVPYSGNSAWDGHGNHNGAWPSDVYYGVMNGLWTDSRINNTNPAREANDNIPGDGKWDQNQAAGDVDLEIGRVDFFNMPAFALSEIGLTRKYLNKLHAYKTRQIQPVYRALIDDNFGYFRGEAFSQSGWRSFNTFFPPDSVYSKFVHGVDYFTDLPERSYLWSYGCGGGNYRGAGGIGSTSDFASKEVQTIFTMVFGSYFGDWDVQDNFLRAALGSGTTLTNCWAGRPVWFMHHMALGENIGYSTVVSQSSTNSNYAPVGFASRGTHTALLGDPSLRMYMITPPTQLTLLNQGNGTVYAEWQPSPDSNIIGYHLYRRSPDEMLYTRVTDVPVDDLSFVDTVTTDTGDYVYLLRAVRLEVTGTGSFYNLSPGAMGGVEVTTRTKKLAIEDKIQLFPNPVTSYFVLRGSFTNESMLKVRINDVFGRQVWYGKINPESKVDVSALPSGTYFAIILNEQGQNKTVKFVKQ